MRGACLTDRISASGVLPRQYFAVIFSFCTKVRSPFPDVQKYLRRRQEHDNRKYIRVTKKSKFGIFAIRLGCWLRRPELQLKTQLVPAAHPKNLVWTRLLTCISTAMAGWKPMPVWRSQRRRLQPPQLSMHWKMDARFKKAPLPEILRSEPCVK